MRRIPSRAIAGVGSLNQREDVVLFRDGGKIDRGVDDSSLVENHESNHVGDRDAVPVTCSRTIGEKISNKSPHLQIRVRRFGGARMHVV